MGGEKVIDRIGFLSKRGLSLEPRGEGSSCSGTPGKGSPPLTTEGNSQGWVAEGWEASLVA